MQTCASSHHLFLSKWPWVEWLFGYSSWNVSVVIWELFISLVLESELKNDNSAIGIYGLLYSLRASSEQYIWEHLVIFKVVYK